jgi:hypothetical protein
MSGTAEVELRLASLDDRPGILSLFERTFGKPKSGERWRWQYDDPPSGEGIVTVALSDGQVVGCAALMRQDLNFQGDRLPAAQACDGMLHEGFRGAGRYAALASMTHSRAAEQGLVSVIGFPNLPAYPTQIRNVSYSRTLRFHYFYTRTSAPPRLGRGAGVVATPLLAVGNRLRLRVSRLRLGANLDVESGRSVPDDIDKLLRHHRMQEVVSVWKDAEYLRWRYENHPDYDYRFHVLRRGPAPLAVAVTRRVRGAVLICELVHPNKEVYEAAYLVRRVVDLEGRSASTVGFFGWDAGFYEAVLKEAGFHHVPHSPFVKIARVLKHHPLETAFRIPSNWTMVHGDTDVV